MIVLNREPDKGRTHAWKCLCDCGTEKVIRGPAIKYGYTKSCGCIRREMMREKMTKHGMSDTRFYRIWSAMLTRCTNPNDKYYDIYGGKGIQVCEKWESFEGFREDMLESYEIHTKDRGETNTSIDRIDPNGHYARDNCRWATSLEQVRNRDYGGRVVGIRKSENGEKWLANIGVGYKLIHLGTFDTHAEALEARRDAEIKHWEEC